MSFLHLYTLDVGYLIENAPIWFVIASHLEILILANFGKYHITWIDLVKLLCKVN